MTKVPIESLESLLVYRNILNDEVVAQLSTSTQKTCKNQAKLCYELINKAELLGLHGNIIKNYILYLLARDENIFSIMAEKNNGFIGSSLYNAVLQDITTISHFLTNDFSALLQSDILIDYSPTNKQFNPVLDRLEKYFATSSYTPKETVKQLTQFYMQYGYGKMADFAAFRWSLEDGLTGITGNDPITLDDIIGYEKQKAVLVKNTEAFLQNKPCNNVLLTGARGTGKSSSVKALANHYFEIGLRIVEISKYELRNLHKAINSLRGFGKKFILFLDDLSFEEFEADYKCLKSVLEGGVEAKPDNILIYATSNRRHLIRESWNDRSEQENDMHRFDTVNEKISLSDRFGITLSYFTPSQEEYFKIVEEIAVKNDIKLDAAKLKAEALKWEMSHSGRSGRTARQLVAHILGA
jgi:predicted AAA+ superfamily ATPase